MLLLAALSSFAASPESAPSACPASVEGLPAASWLDRADSRLRGPALVVVLAADRRLGLYSAGALSMCVPIGLAPAVDGAKRAQGDRKTPQGWYRTSDRPTSAFYHALNLHYPNVADADQALADHRVTQATHDRLVAAAAADRMPPNDTPLGGLILIHGGGSSSDWTLGCVALDDADIDRLRAELPATLRTDALLLP